jgi:hypothetical protein
VKRMRKSLSYANVMSSIAVFLVLGGATAFAAGKIGPHRLKANAVTTPKIKANAVTTRKIRKNAVTTRKVRDNAIREEKIADSAVTTGKIADSAVTGAKIDADSTPFSQVTDQLRGTAKLPFAAGQLYPLNDPTYTQPAGRDDQYVAGVEVNFPAGCEAPRSATVELLIDAADPQNPTPFEIAGQGGVTDESSGASTRLINFAPSTGLRGLTSFAPKAPTDHTFAIYMQSVSCNNAVAGVTAVGAGVDVIGTK